MGQFGERRRHRVAGVDVSDQHPARVHHDAPVYLPASSANGLTISIDSGSAAAYAGEPQAGSHNLLGWIDSGDSLTVSGLGVGEVLSIQGFAGFGYTLIEGGAPTTTTTLPATTTTTSTTTTCRPPPHHTPGHHHHDSAGHHHQHHTPGHHHHDSAGHHHQHHTPGHHDHDSAGHHHQHHAAGHHHHDSPATTTTTTLPATTTTLPATTTTARRSVRTQQRPPSTCTGTARPVRAHGEAAAGGFAAVWPSPAAPVTQRLGYTTSAGVYLPAEQANGLTIAVDSGSATAYAGDPQAGSHRALATIYAGQTYEVTGLGPTEVLSIQSGGSFSFRHTEISPSHHTTTTTTTTTLPATTHDAAGHHHHVARRSVRTHSRRRVRVLELHVVPVPMGRQRRQLRRRLATTSGRGLPTTRLHHVRRRLPPRRAGQRPHHRGRLRQRDGLRRRPPSRLPSGARNDLRRPDLRGHRTRPHRSPQHPERRILQLPPHRDQPLDHTDDHHDAAGHHHDARRPPPRPRPRCRPPPRRRPPIRSDPAAAAQYVYWNCTSGPCPWGGAAGGFAARLVATGSPGHPTTRLHHLPRRLSPRRAGQRPHHRGRLRQRDGLRRRPPSRLPSGARNDLRRPDLRGHRTRAHRSPQHPERRILQLPPHRDQPLDHTHHHDRPPHSRVRRPPHFRVRRPRRRPHRRRVRAPMPPVAIRSTPTSLGGDARRPAAPRRTGRGP